MRKFVAVLSGVFALSAAPAFAQAERDPSVLEEVPSGDPSELGLERDLSLFGQAGGLTYTGDAAQLTAPGVAYGVNLGVDVVPWVNAEVGYHGAAYSVDDSLANDGTILENGGQLLAKVGPQMNNFTPYALGGVNLTQLSAPEDVVLVDDAFMVRIPVGLGVEWANEGAGAEADLLLGARATYQATVNSGAFPTLDDAGAANQVMGSLYAGARF